MMKGVGRERDGQLGAGADGAEQHVDGGRAAHLAGYHISRMAFTLDTQAMIKAARE